jgi:hypothetical protein
VVKGKACTSCGEWELDWMRSQLGEEAACHGNEVLDEPANRSAATGDLRWASDPFRRVELMRVEFMRGILGQPE